MKTESKLPKGFVPSTIKYAEQCGEYKDIKASFENSLKELENNHPKLVRTNFSSDFIEDLWNAVLWALTPISAIDPDYMDSEWPEIRKDWSGILKTAQKLRGLISDEGKLGLLPDISEHIDPLGYLIEDMEAALEKMPEAKPEENRKVNVKNWKTGFTIKVLAIGFDIHKHTKLVTGEENGVFVETAAIVLKTANQIAEENYGDIFVNEDAPKFTRPILSKMRRDGLLPSK